MEPNAQNLWDSFRDILRDANFFPATPRNPSFDETLRLLKSLAFEIPPEDLRVIDQGYLSHEKSLLTPQRLEELTQMRRNTGLSELTVEQVREREIARSSTLKHIELLSFPNPDIRVALLARFGAASSVGCLRDILDLDESEEVRIEVVHALTRRLAREDTPTPEKGEIGTLLSKLISNGFYVGLELEVARAAYSAIRSRDDIELPPPLQGIRTTYWSGGSLSALPRDERLGVLRFFGEYMTAPELIDHLETERDYDVMSALVENLERNWELGVAPDGFDGEVSRTEFSKRVATVLLTKLGLDEVPPGLRDDLLRCEPWSKEPPAKAILRRLAIRALADFEED